jgi:hypothetical protein
MSLLSEANRNYIKYKWRSQSGYKVIKRKTMLTQRS